MKRLSILPVILVITLAGCANNKSPTNNEFDPQAQQPEIQAPAEPEAQSLELGTEYSLTQCGYDQPCEVNVRFDDIELTETCPLGTAYDDIPAMDPVKSIYLTVSGSYQVVKADSNYSISEMDFQGLTSSGVAKEPGIAYDCNSPNVDEALDNPVDPGLTREGSLTMTLDPEVETLRFAPVGDPVVREINLSDFELEPGSGEVPPPEEKTESM